MGSEEFMKERIILENFALLDALGTHTSSSVSLVSGLESSSSASADVTLLITASETSKKSRLLFSLNARRSRSSQKGHLPDLVKWILQI